MTTQIEAMKMALVALETVEELRRDAARYRFMRDWCKSDLRFVGIGLRHGDSLDSTLDAAMQEKQP